MRKVKAGALQLTLFICVVIALLLFAFVILIHTHKRFNTMSDQTVAVVKNADEGIRYALSNNLKLNDTINSNLESDIGELVKVHRGYWGLFEKVSAKSTIKTKRFNKIALVGDVQSKTNRTVLYVQDNNKPLVLVGNTRIQGDAYVSKQGVKTGNISGNSYYGERLIYGQTKTASNFPKLLPETILNIKKLQNTINTIESNQVLDISDRKPKKNSFLKPPKYVLSNTDIILSDISVIGNIIVQSKTRVVVDRSSNLRDIILIAPKIEIRNNVTGSFQGIATKEILVGKNCKLKYPSALIVNEIKSAAINVSKALESNKITLGTNSEVNGVVVYLGQQKPNTAKTQVILEESSIVRGEVYCNQNLELKGVVNGTVFTANFMANQFGSIYQNHIYNGTINIDKLPLEYVGLSFNTKKKGVVKWLY